MTVVAPAEPLPHDVLQSLQQHRLGDPFLLLGPQSSADAFCLRAWRPESSECWLGDEEGPVLAMQHLGEGLFEWSGLAEAVPHPYRLHWRDVHGEWRDALDPYAFRQPLIADFDLHLFGQGRHWNIHDWLGAHPVMIDGTAGVRFAVWAPHAQRVSVVGDFNGWDGRTHLMRGSASGVWQLFVPELAAGALYKYEIRAADGAILLKADPYARRCQLRPETASQVAAAREHAWNDEEWLQSRRKRDPLRAPLSIYEVHLGSWQRADDGGFLNYRELAHRLAPYARGMGFTHVELLPVSEHPFDGSWGYQTIGLYAPTSRHGTPDDFRYFIDYCHAQGLGVILDWVPAHFPKDAHGLARFDGQPLYEYPDPLRGEHPQWGTLVYDYGRPQVRNLLIANALYWFDEFHIDGLRVDAVASMICLDYGREPGEWQPNRYGGHEHLEAVQFLRDLNTVVHGQHPGAMVIAEESTSWPGVSRPVNHSAPAGGLGFTMKWDLGWMHDSLDYFMQDPLYRRYHQQKLSFGLMYAWNENFVLPLSHDEVVHLKKSLLAKMPGDEWQQFANLRLLYGWMWTRPGKKLLFMGGEFGQRREWNHDRALDWELDTWSWHAGLRQWVTDLNGAYTELPALHELDFDTAGFEWIDCHNADESVFVYRRRDRAGRDVVMVLNATPVPRFGYRVGVPRSGTWIERLNSDASLYGGGDVGNGGRVQAQNLGFNNQPCSVDLVLPPLGMLLLTPA